MSHPDPNSRSLRGAISAAVRTGDHEAAAELRRELSLINIERAILKQLDGTPLTAAELRRLRLALEANGPRRVPAPELATSGGSAA